MVEVLEKEKSETRAERFQRIAEARVNAILEKVRLLANCSNKSSYDYTEDEVDLIFSTLERELKNAKNKFKSHVKGKKKFTLIS